MVCHRSDRLALGSVGRTAHLCWARELGAPPPPVLVGSRPCLDHRSPVLGCVRQNPALKLASKTDGTSRGDNSSTEMHSRGQASKTGGAGGSKTGASASGKA